MKKDPVEVATLASDSTVATWANMDRTVTPSFSYIAYIQGPGGEIAGLGSHFANTQCKAPHPTQLRSPGTKYGPLSNVSAKKTGTFEAPA